MTNPARDIYRYRDDVLQDTGSGDALVFSHGTLMDRTMFQPQINHLSKDHRTIAYNLRARTERYSPEYDLYDLVDDLDTLTERMKLENPVHIGMSMGGYIGLRYALQYPDKLSALILIDSSAAQETEQNKEQYSEYIEQLRGKNTPPNPLIEVAASILFGQTTQSENSELVENWKNRWRTYPGDAVVHEMNSWLDRDEIYPDIPDIDIPVLAIHGEEDIAVPLSDARDTVEAINDAELEIIPEAGHTSNQEKPELVNKAIQRFISSI